MLDRAGREAHAPDAAFSVEQIERVGLRAGTVHAFQGGEADAVVASLGLVDGDSPARSRFAGYP
ncbi:hypothetical protein [Phytohabitans rumicis]|uniref:Uncharacterized protein n=1 Tax=Phytohabitans rumicis TaxID=1076125 RepID=A0A6V8KQD8_9ACTN|nr:hypothetical protein [Phytohabitans rumicis]GFJ87392.1 hypothetical protein Prum_010340 [Phytohabitans rumicis]